MMSNRTWNYWVAAAFLLGGLAVVMFNYFVDPYELFGHPYLRSGYAVNERFRKVNHLLHNESHDSYILGSSVMGVFDPDVANRITGHSFYNLSFLSGTPQEAFDSLRALKRHGKPIKEVLIGIDFYQFYERPHIMSTNRPHPAVSGKSWLSFYSSYLFASGLWQGLTRIAHHLQSQPSIFLMSMARGCITCMNTNAVGHPTPNNTTAIISSQTHGTGRIFAGWRSVLLNLRNCVNDWMRTRSKQNYSSTRFIGIRL